LTVKKESKVIELWQASNWTTDKQGIYLGEISQDWSQGRTAFGGILASAAIRAMQEKLEAGRYLRSALVAFVAPVRIGKAEIDVQLLRAGRSLSSLEAKIFQEDKIRTQITACFGENRKTCIQIQGNPRPETTPPEELEPMPYVENGTPAFTQHFEFRMISPMPFGGAQNTPHLRGWIRARDEHNIDAASLLSLIDAWPPPEIITQPRPFPLSSVTWQINLLSVLPKEGITPDQWWFYDSHTTWAAGGYSDNQACLWSPEGQPAAHSRQLVAEFSADCD
jgi:acyl-CoA thioesterase